MTGAGTAIYWNNMPHSGVIVRADRSGGVAVLCGATDIGQGSDSILAYLPPRCSASSPRTSACTPPTPTSRRSISAPTRRASRSCAGMAAIQAADAPARPISAAVARKLEVAARAARVPRPQGRRARRLGQGGARSPQAVALGEAMHGVLAFPGSYAPPKRAGKYKGGGVGPSPCYSYSACVVELTVDEETGEIELHDVWIAHDIGRALNPLLVEGQVEGSVYMGIGEALMEEQVFRKGLHKHPSLLDYKSPTTLETPEIHTILVETDDPEGPFGAKEAGQGPLLPVIPAIANAIYDAVGVRIDEVPITPDKILRGLELARQGKAARVGPERIPLFTFKEPLAVESAFGQPADAIAVRPFATRARIEMRHDSARRDERTCSAPGPAHPRSTGGASRPMLGSAFTYLAPRTVAEAARLLGEHGARRMLVAGGTDLYPNMKRRQFEPTVLVGPARHRASSAASRGTARDGPDASAPATTLTAVARHPEVARHYPALATAAGLVSSPQLRNMGTIGGNVCVDTRCNYYNQSHEWRKADRLLHEEGRRHLPGRAGQPALLGGVVVRHRARAVEPRRARSGWSGPSGERTFPIGALYRDDGIEYLRQAPDEILDRDPAAARPTAGRRRT